MGGSSAPLTDPKSGPAVRLGGVHKAQCPKRRVWLWPGGDGFLPITLTFRTKTIKHHIHANLPPQIMLLGHDISQQLPFPTAAPFPEGL